MTLAKSAALQVYTENSQSSLDLPEGWAFPKVGEILAVNYGKGLKKEKRMPGPIPVYGSNGVVGKHNIPLTHGPTIILGRKGTVGAVHFSKVPCWPIDTTYFMDEFNGLAPRYLVYALRKLNLPQLDTSTAIPGLNRDELYSQYVPLAPMAEQKRIVAKVERLLSRVNAARERLAKVPEILKRFRQSVFAAACSGGLTADWREKYSNVEPAWELLTKLARKNKKRIKIGESEISTWITVKVQDVFNSHGGGTPTKSNPVYWSGNIPWVASGDVKNDHIEKSSLYITKEGLENSSARVCPADSVIVVVRSGILRHTLPVSVVKKPLAINQDIKCFDSTNSRVNYWLFLNIKAHKNQILALNREGTTVQSVKYETLKDFEINVPPPTEQEEIVRRVEALFSLADAIEKRLAVATTRAEKLTQAILAKAFRGKLVPTEAELAHREGRSYEPAPALLCKIEAQRKDVEVQRKRGRSWQRRNK